MNRLIVLIISFLFVATNALAQQYFIHDSRTDAPIPFVKVFPSKGEPFLSDLDGMFNISEEVSSVELKYIGYIDTLVQLNRIENNIIHFRKDIQEVQSVYVTPGENPAHRIIRKAQENRKANHPLKNDAFKYNSYSKFIFDVNESIMEPEDANDTMSIKLKKYFTEQHLFVMESATRRTFFPPSRDQEEIIAYKLSGTKDPSLSTFAQSMQSFNFYDKEFTILGESFMNPIAGDGINRYLFILEDTLINAQDSTYTIYFRPRKGKNFKGLEGRLYINTNGFAVEKVNASASRPEGTGAFDVTIIQEYAFIENKKWFPIKLSTNLEFGTFASGKDTIKGMVLGRGNTYIDSIVINPNEKKKGFYDNFDLYTATDAAELSEQEWEKLRIYELTQKEARTHQMVDSIAEANNIENKLSFLQELANGKLRWGYVAIPIERLFQYNEYEGYRLGTGLETSSKVSKVFSIGGYFGWGTRDKAWKYGGYSTIFFSRKRNTKLDLKFQQDLFERGGHEFTVQGFDPNSTHLLRSFFINQMEKQRLAEVALSSDIKANMNLRLFGNYQRVEFTDNYEFAPENTLVYDPFNKLDIAEIGAELKWNIGEKYMLVGNNKISQGLKYPSIRLMASQGLAGLWESKYHYWRLNGEISQQFKVRDYFTFNVRLSASKTIGDVPLFLLHNARGTQIDWMIDVENTFQTMAAGSFYSRQQACLFTRLKLKAIHTKAQWNEPQFSLHHAIGFGDFTDRDSHNLGFNTMEKGYYEAGIAVNNLIILNKVSGFGVGVFQNYGPYSNYRVIPKLTLNFVF